MRTKTKLPRVLKIHQIDGFKVTCVFNTGEYKLIDFERLFKDWDVQEGDTEYPLLNPAEFRQVTVNESHTLAWPNVKISFPSFDNSDQLAFAPYDISPDVLYEAGETVRRAMPDIGGIIRNARIKAGLTQEQLAWKVGSTKHYISRLENGRSDIEVATLWRIIEIGLEEDLKITVGSGVSPKRFSYRGGSDSSKALPI